MQRLQIMDPQRTESSRLAHWEFYPLQNYEYPPPGTVLSRTGEILRNSDIVMLIVDALPKPVFPRIATKESRESRAARLDLYNLARASTDFFYPAMQEAWKVLPDVRALIKTLHIGAVGVELEPASWRTYKAVELSLLR